MFQFQRDTSIRQLRGAATRLSGDTDKSRTMADFAATWQPEPLPQGRPVNPDGLDRRRSLSPGGQLQSVLPVRQSQRQGDRFLP